MSAPIFIQNGLGAASEVTFSDDEGLVITANTPPVRREITEDEWITATNQQWAQANPEGWKALQTKLGIPMWVGIGALVGAGIAMALGKPKLGAPLGVLGVAGIATSLVMRKNDLGTLAGLGEVGPGWHRTRALAGAPVMPSFFQGLSPLNGANVFVEGR